jgi:hypothetical protein
MNLVLHSRLGATGPHGACPRAFPAFYEERRGEPGRAERQAVGRRKRLWVSTLPNAVVESENRALRRRSLYSSSVSNEFTFSAFVRRKNKPEESWASKGQ